MAGRRIISTRNDVYLLSDGLVELVLKPAGTGLAPDVGHLEDKGFGDRRTSADWVFSKEMDELRPILHINGPSGIGWFLFRNGVPRQLIK